jgi:N-acetylglucosamine-6-phosphate deacetylase
MIVLSGADVILPSGCLSPGTVIVDGERITHVAAGTRPADRADQHVDLAGFYLVPGFIDVHVHGAEGLDTLDAGDPIAELARRLPRYGVTAFAPTSIACDPPALSRLLGGVRRARTAPLRGARVLLQRGAAARVPAGPARPPGRGRVHRRGDPRRHRGIEA